MAFEDPINEKFFKPGWRDQLGTVAPPAAPEPVIGVGLPPTPSVPLFKPTPLPNALNPAQSLKGSALPPPVAAPQPDVPPGPTDWGGVGRDIVNAARDFPTQVKGALAGALQAREDVGAPGTLTNWRKAAADLARMRQQEDIAGGNQVVFPIPGANITRQEIRDFPTNAAFSVTGMAAGLGAGLGAAAVPGLRAFAKPIGMAAAGTAAFRQSSNQLLSDVLDAASQGAGRNLTDEERSYLINKFGSAATEHGLWEAIPETASQAFGLKTIAAPLAKTLTKAFGESVGKDVFTRMAKMYGMEIGTEAITQHGQHNVAVEAGLAEGPKRSFISPSDIGQSLAEVAPATILQTTVTSGLGLTGRKALDLMHSQQAQKTIQGALGEVTPQAQPPAQPAPQLAPWPTFPPPYEVQRRMPGAMPPEEAPPPAQAPSPLASWSQTLGQTAPQASPWAPAPVQTAPQVATLAPTPSPLGLEAPITNPLPEESPNAQQPPIATTPPPVAPSFRAATLEERIAVESGRGLPVTDLKKNPTGWRMFPGGNNDSLTLVSEDGRRSARFTNHAPSSGSGSQRMMAEAHAFAIDNPVASTLVPPGELVSQPIFNAKKESPNAQQIPSTETPDGGVRPRMEPEVGGVSAPGSVQGVQQGGPESGAEETSPPPVDSTIKENLTVQGYKVAVNPPKTPVEETKLQNRGYSPFSLNEQGQLIQAKGPDSVWARPPVAEKPPTRKPKSGADPSVDSLTAAIAKLGGLNLQEAKDQGIDNAYFGPKGHRGQGISHTFTRQGLSFDGMAQSLDELGYPVRDSAGRYDPNVLLDLLTKELNGQKVYSNRANYDRIPQAQRAPEPQEQPSLAEALARASASLNGDEISAIEDRLAKQMPDASPEEFNRSFIEELNNATTAAKNAADAHAARPAKGQETGGPGAYANAGQGQPEAVGEKGLLGQGTQAEKNTLVAVMDVYGNRRYVRQEDLDNPRIKEMSLFNANGTLWGANIHKENIERPSGSLTPKELSLQQQRKAEAEANRQEERIAQKRMHFRQRLEKEGYTMLAPRGWPKTQRAENHLRRLGYKSYIENADGDAVDDPKNMGDWAKPPEGAAPQAASAKKPRRAPRVAAEAKGPTEPTAAPQKQAEEAQKPQPPILKEGATDNDTQRKTTLPAGKPVPQGPGSEAVPPVAGRRTTGTALPRDGGTDAGGVRRGNGPGDNRSEPVGSAEGIPASGQGPVSQRGTTADLGNNPPNVPGKPRGDDYRISQGELTRDVSWLVSARRNVDAVELVAKLKKENRNPTKEEQAVLVQFVGWGPSEIRNKLFPTNAGIGAKYNPNAIYDKSWRDLGERVATVFTEEDWRTVARSTQYAHYTGEPVVRAIWRAMEWLGFPGGSILEPGAGIGLFAGMMPEGVYKNSRYLGIELDGFTAAIGGLLNPSMTVRHQDYTKTKVPKNFFDAAIGNPPFLDVEVVSDPEYRKQKFLLHDYFFAKTIDSVRPGGLLVFVTSNGTMDKQATVARQYLSERADLLGAIRLPQTAFKQNAGTEVVTDIIFLRKRTPGEANAGAAWAESVPMTIDGVEQRVNEYYVSHPEMVLGKHSSSGSMYRSGSYTVIPKEGDIQQQILEAVKGLPSNIYSVLKPETSASTTTAATIEKDYNPGQRKEGGVYIAENGEIYRKENGVGVPLGELVKLSQKEEAFVRDYVGLRDAVKQAHYDQLNDGDWPASLKAVNSSYDAFLSKHGNVLAYNIIEKTQVDADGEPRVTEERRYKNIRALRTDVEFPLVLTLEEIQDDGQIIKGPMLRGRVLNRPSVPEIKTASDALAVSLAASGRFDLGDAARRYSVSEEEMFALLGDLVYRDPNGTAVMSDEYLSGNVKAKLEEAKAAASVDSRYQRNVDALEKVQPPVLGAADITVQLGAAWVPPTIVKTFAEKVLKIPDAKVSYSKATGQWDVHGSDGPIRSRSASNEWGTAYRSPTELLDAVLNKRPIRVYETVKENGKSKQVFLPEVTVAANDMAKKIADEFSSWVWQEGRRAEQLISLYNDTFNLFSPRTFDGSHIQPVGLSLSFALHDHQKRAIWRQIASGNTYLAHAVGAGKTLEMIIGGMEQRRLGLIKKPMYIVPNHMLEQFSAEFMEAYPAANIMVADEKNFDTENRRRFIAQAALNDPDAVVLTHSAFEKLQLRPKNLSATIDEITDQLRDQLDEMPDDDSPGTKRSRRQIESRIEALEQRLVAKTDSTEKDAALYFEDLGVDYLYVDEAHEFRKLDFATNLKVKGVSPEGSQMAMDLYAKTRWLDSQRPGRSFTFASGTPITNTMAEMYSVQRFFQRGLMKQDGLHHFDAWASQFGQVAKFYERNASGQVEVVERFGKFVNVYDMMSRTLEFMDVVTGTELVERFAKMAAEGKPVLFPSPAPGNAGRRHVITVEQSEHLRNYLAGDLANRLEISRNWKPTKEEPNNFDPVFNIITDGRLSSIDFRFVKPSMKDDPGSKLNRMIDEIISIHKETAKNTYLDKTTGKVSPVKGATQIVFASVGFGPGVIQNRGFDSRAWVMRRLSAAGIKASEVAWIWDYPGNKKKALFKDVRDGKIRILIGTPKNMGTGVNVQNRLFALHHLDAPWYPSDMEQPEGRILRQGNQNKEVRIIGYATDGSYDSTMWGMVARKAGFIEQAFKGDRRMRVMEDISEASQYALASAIASGDQRYIKLAELEGDIAHLEIARKSHDERQRSIVSEIRQIEAAIDWDKSRLPEAKKAAEELSTERFYSGFINGEVGGETLSKATSTALGEAIIKAHEQARRELLAKAVTESTGSEAVKYVTLHRNLGVVNKIQLEFAGKWGGVNGDINSPSVHQRTADLYAKYNGKPFANILSWGDQWTPMQATSALLDSARNLVGLPLKIEQAIKRRKEDLSDLRNRRGAPFPHEQEYIDKLGQLHALREDLVRSGKAIEPLALGPLEEEREYQAPSDMDWEGGGQASRFSLDAQKPKATQLSVDDVKRKLSGIPLLNAVSVPINVVNSEADLPRAVQREIRRQNADGSVSAVFHGGSVYLVAQNLSTAAEIEEAVLHEIAHVGVRKLYGPNGIQALRAIHQAVGGDEGIRALAKSHGFDMEAYFKAAETAYANDPLGRRVMLADELLAHLAQHGPKSLPAKIVMALRQFMGAVRSWLREQGFDAWLREKGWADLSQWNDADLAHELRRIMDAAKGDAKRAPGGTRFLFAGRQAKTADQEGREFARRFSLSGYDEENTRKMTGWHQGADGEWRFEIDDSQARLLQPRKDIERLKQGLSVSGPLGGVLEHKELFAAYPHLARLWVKIVPGLQGGSYDAKNRVIEIGWNSDENPLSSLLHEIQHAIQDVEVFARGGSVSAILSSLQNSSSDREAISEAVSGELEKEDIKELLDNAKQAKSNGDWQVERTLIYRANYLAAYRVYARLAGEVEARNVQARLDFTANERVGIPPSFTEPVPLSQQIVMFRNKLGESGLIPFHKEEMAAAPDISDDAILRDLIKHYAGTENAPSEGEITRAVQQYKQVEKENSDILNSKKPLPAPNGKPSNLNREQWLLVRTPNFKKWFGDWENGPELASKVVDANGEPRVVYHGTFDDFSVFDRRKLGENTLSMAEGEGYGQTSRIGFWFNSNPMGKSKEKYGAGYTIDVPAFINITNPYVAPSLDRLAGKVSWGGGSGIGLKNKLKRAGHDGVTLRDEEFGGVSYVVFDRKAIKSAIGNIGTYSKNSGDIRFQLRPPDQDANAYQADMAAQTAILTDAATKSGYKTIDEWAQAQPTRFMEEAARWRDDHPMRFSIAASMTRSPQSLGGMADSVRDAISDWISYPGSDTRPKWWDKTVGSMRNLASRSPEFKRVLDIIEQAHWDATRLASAPEKLAPLWFRDLSGGIRQAIKTGNLSTADQKIVSDALNAITTGEKRRHDISTLQGKAALAKHGITTDTQLQAYDQAMKAIELATDQSARALSVRIGQASHLDHGMLSALFDKSQDLNELNQDLSDWIRGGPTSPDIIGQDRKKNPVFSVHWLEEAKKTNELEVARLQAAKAQAKDIQPYLDQIEALDKSLEDHKTLLERLRDVKDRAGKLKFEGYVPLMRFGKYTVTAVDANGKHQPDLPFLMFETRHEANRAARELRGKGFTIRQETMNPDQWKMFDGISPEAMSAFADLLPKAMQEVMQQWIKHAVADSSAMKRMLHRNEVPGWYPDAQRVIAQYLVSTARLASRNLHSVAEDQALRDIKQGDTQQQAQRLIEYLKNPDEEFSGLRNFLFFWYLGGSISSAITNLTQPILTTIPKLSTYGLAAPAVVARWMAKAPTGVVPKKYQANFQRGVDEGVISPQETYNLMATARGGAFGGGKMMRSRPVQIGMVAWGSLFARAEQFNRRVTFLSALEMAENDPSILKKTGVASPYEFAKKMVDDTQFVYARWNRPAWARGAGAPLFTFKQFTLQYAEFLMSLPLPQRALALGLLALAAGLTGLPGEEDAEDVIDTIGQWLGYPTNSRAWLKTYVPSVVLSGLQDLGLPFDIQARLGLGNMAPGTGAMIPSNTNRARDVAEVFGPAGSLVSNAVQATAAAVKGDISGAFSLMAPRAVSSGLKGYDMAMTGMARDRAGNKVDDVTGFETAMQFANFTPRRVAETYSTSRVNQEIKDYQQMRESSLVNRIARARIEGDETALQKAKDEWESWNEGHPDRPIIITPAQIRKRVRDMLTDKEARVIRSMPKEIRRMGAEMYGEEGEED